MTLKLNLVRMSAYAKILLVLSIFAILPCEAHNEQVLKRVHDEEQKFDKTQDDRPAIDWDGLAKLRNLQKQLLTLKKGSVTYLASNVFSATTLKNGFDLSELVADDTIHVTEFDYSAISLKGGEKLIVECAWPADALSRCDFYFGNPGKMHEDGYRSVVKLAYSGGFVTLPSQLPERDMLLFALVKPKSGAYFKFVFVVRSK